MTSTQPFQMRSYRGAVLSIADEVRHMKDDPKDPPEVETVPSGVG